MKLNYVRAIHVRNSPDNDGKLNAFVPAAMCHKHSVSQSSENLILGW